MQANLDPEKIELMDRYLDKQLNSDELLSFEYELEHDPEMFCELEDYRLFRDSLLVYTRPMRVIGAIKKRNTPFKNVFFVQSALFLFVSLLVSLTFVLSALLLRTNNALLYSDNYIALNISQINPAGELAVNFIGGNFAMVITAHQNTANWRPQDKLLVANAYLKLNQPEKAIFLLEGIRQKDNTIDPVLYKSATYYLGMAYLLNHEEANALPLFKQIHQDKSHPYHHVANNWFLLKLKLLVYF